VFYELGLERTRIVKLYLEESFLACHPDRSAGEFVSQENPAARSGGIPRKDLAPCCSREFSQDASRTSPPPRRKLINARAIGLPSCLTRQSVRAQIIGIIDGENSLWRPGQGWCVGISPLRARVSCAEERLCGAPVEMTVNPESVEWDDSGRDARGSRQTAAEQVPHPTPPRVARLRGIRDGSGWGVVAGRWQERGRRERM